MAGPLDEEASAEVVPEDSSVSFVDSPGSAKHPPRSNEANRDGKKRIDLDLTSPKSTAANPLDGSRDQPKKTSATRNSR